MELGIMQQASWFQAFNQSLFNSSFMNFPSAQVISGKVCSFCEKNGEDESFYTSHELKDENDEIVCPVIKKYTCPHCHVTGKHTASYCPLSPKLRTSTKASPISRKSSPRSANKQSSRLASPRSALKPRNKSPKSKEEEEEQSSVARMQKILQIVKQFEVHIARELYLASLEQTLRSLCIQ